MIARIPFDVAATWPVRKRLRVRGEIGGFPFRTALFAFGNGEGHFLLVNKKMQAAAGARVGQNVRIRLEPDLDEREAVVPEELARALKEDRRLRQYFDALGFARRKDIGKWVMEPEERSIAQKARGADGGMAAAYA